MLSIFKKDNTEFLAIARADDSTDPGSLMGCWADPRPLGMNLMETYIKPSEPKHANGVEFVCHLHERSLLEFTGSEVSANHAKQLINALYTEADRETFLVCLFRNWVKWNGTHFVFLAPDPTEQGLYPRRASQRISEMFLISRQIEVENDEWRFVSPEAAKAREEYLRSQGAIE